MNKIKIYNILYSKSDYTRRPTSFRPAARIYRSTASSTMRRTGIISFRTEYNINIQYVNMRITHYTAVKQL